MDKALSIWQEILEDARYAPSPHNIQPWKIKIISEKEATLLYDPKRLIPDEDKQGSFTLLSFAVFLEYAAVIAQGKGLALAYHYNGALFDAGADECKPLFNLNLTPTSESPSFDPELIKQRRTSRLPYNEKPISQNTLDELTLVAKEHGHTYTFTQDPDLVQWIVRLNCNTLFYDLNDTATRQEIGSWLRYTKKEAVHKGDGLAAYCLHLPGIFLRLVFRYHTIARLPLIGSFFKWYYCRTMRGTAIAGWIQGPFATPLDWLNAGHLLAKTWLILTKHGMYLHPFGSTITNPLAHNQLREKFEVDESKESLWMIMRLGHSNLPPRSERLSVENIIIP